MEYSDLVTFIQGHFTDGLVLVVGSGLSIAEGIPGMPQLAEHLVMASASLAAPELEEWQVIESEVKIIGLEAALLKNPPSVALEKWITNETCKLIIPFERNVIELVLDGKHDLRLTKFLNHVLKPKAGLPILTTNYDRLVEIGCEMAGLHVDTTAVGIYAGHFDHTQSCMASCRGVATRSRITVLEHFPRAVVLKPHGSFDWFDGQNGPRRCSIDIDCERLIITPGLNKYRAGYDTPFDKHREIANDHINKAAKLLIVGYGFNDDHLQTHLVRRIKEHLPTLILNLAIGDVVEQLVDQSSKCIALSKLDDGSGVIVHHKDGQFLRKGPDLWDLGILVEEILT
jgi:hypothetical protein